MPDGDLLATMVHVPAPTMVTVAALTVQTLVVDEAKLTAELEVAVALSVKAASPRDLLDSAPKEMVCGTTPVIATGVYELSTDPLPI